MVIYLLHYVFISFRKPHVIGQKDMSLKLKFHIPIKHTTIQPCTFLGTIFELHEN
jgi:hypothetical protein